MFLKNVEKDNYSLLINDKALITRCKIMKIIYKIDLDKIFKINRNIDKVLR